VHRSLVGHTGPVTALQFDDVHLITGSADRSIRVSQTISSADISLLMCLDLGSSDWLDPRCLRLRPPRDKHDV
jgi:WD40 repeat protein